MTDVQKLQKTDVEWLKACTLHIRGMPWEDRAGLGLRQKLQKFLDDKNGKVLGVQIVPPFANIFEIEVKIRDLKDLNMLMVFDDS